MDSLKYDMAKTPEIQKNRARRATIIKRRRMAVAILGIAIVGLILFFSVRLISAFDKTKLPANSKGRKTVTDVVTYLNENGWKVDDSTATQDTVIIPKEFNKIYAEYNDVQKLQKFDLKQFRGKEVKRYSFKVVNYNEITENVYATVLVYGDNVIGGDVSLWEKDGFIHGFKLPESKKEEKTEKT